MQREPMRNTFLKTNSATRQCGHPLEGATMIGAAIVLGIIFFSVLFVLGLGAILLKMACSAASATVPGLGRAMWIVFVAWFLNGIAASIAGILTGAGTDIRHAPPRAQLALLLVGLLVQASVYSSMVPTSFGKGILIWLLQYVIAFVIVVGMIFLCAVLLSAAAVA
jgi:hypothetical protein